MSFLHQTKESNALIFICIEIFQFQFFISFYKGIANLLRFFHHLLPPTRLLQWCWKLPCRAIYIYNDDFAEISCFLNSLLFHYIHCYYIYAIFSVSLSKHITAWVIIQELFLLMKHCICVKMKYMAKRWNSLSGNIVAIIFTLMVCIAL